MQNILRRGVHGLAALNDLVDTEIAEHARQTRTRAHSDAAVALFGLRRACFRGLVFQLLFHGLQIVGRPGLAAGRQIVVLHAHVLDLRKLQRAVLLGLAQRVARNVRMTWTLNASSSSPMTRLSPMLPRYSRSGSSEVILALAHDEDRVEGEGDILRVENAEIGLFVRCAGVLADDIVAAQAFEHAAQNEAEAHAARVNDAGLF